MDLVVAALGMTPEVGLAESGGLEVEGGIVVDEFSRTSAPGVFAAGDVTAQPHPLLGGRYRIEHWSNAQGQGAAAARNLLGTEIPYAPVPWSSSEQYGAKLEICGWPAAADLYGERGHTVRGEPTALDFTALFWRDDRLVGAAGVGRPDEIAELRRIIADAPRGCFDLLADPATDLTTVGRATPGTPARSGDATRP
ncbi:FAD-dependent oxidoreductase [Spirillospora sp. CA-255316]